MRVWGVLAGLWALGASSSCFNPPYDMACRILCSEPAHTCPGDLHCIAKGSEMVCAPRDETSCPAGPAPATICNQGCLTLPPLLSSGMVLLLWPSNLPPAGSEVTEWDDLSGNGNDALPIYPEALPHSLETGGVRLNGNQVGAGLEIANSPSLAFAGDDFAVIVAAGLNSVLPATFFSKLDGDRTNPREITLAWGIFPGTEVYRANATVNDTTIIAGVEIAQPSVTVYTLWRSAGHVELRLNGTPVGSADLPDARASTTSGQNVFLGVSAPTAPPIDTIDAVIAVRGPVNATDLGTVEAFLRGQFAVTP